MGSMSQTKKTALFDLHLSSGAKMVEFSGYQMPIQYTQGIKSEHLHTRSKAGLFDVSHMGQILVSGIESINDLERLIPIDFQQLRIGQMCYGLLTNDDGCILDDLMITRLGDHEFSLVVNASQKKTDYIYLTENLPNSDVKILTEYSLLALQGPLAERVLSKYINILGELKFLNSAKVLIEGIPCTLSRSGYTGEDGFEISIENNSVNKLANLLLSHPDVDWVGLGARDSLRLEAGLCLYGNDIDSSTSVNEANLQWSISRSRRIDGAKAGNFVGSEALFFGKASFVNKKRVGLVAIDKTPVRNGAKVFDDSEQLIGSVTSGSFSPCLEKPIAMAYLESDFAVIGKYVNAVVRGKTKVMQIVKMPFVTTKYVR